MNSHYLLENYLLGTTDNSSEQNIAFNPFILTCVAQFPLLPSWFPAKLTAYGFPNVLNCFFGWYILHPLSRKLFLILSTWWVFTCYFSILCFWMGFNENQETFISPQM